MFFGRYQNCSPENRDFEGKQSSAYQLPSTENVQADRVLRLVRIEQRLPVESCRLRSHRFDTSFEDRGNTVVGIAGHVHLRTAAACSIRHLSGKHTVLVYIKRFVGPSKTAQERKFRRLPTSTARLSLITGLWKSTELTCSSSTAMALLWPTSTTLFVLR